jgi:hypothetical protein
MQAGDLPSFVVDTLVRVPKAGDEEEASENGGCNFAGGVEPDAIRDYMKRSAGVIRLVSLKLRDAELAWSSVGHVNGTQFLPSQDTEPRRLYIDAAKSLSTCCLTCCLPMVSVGPMA